MVPITITIGLLLIIFSNVIPANCGSSNLPLAPALYVLGDSIVDGGNNNLLPTAAKVNYPPYGNNFNKGATGRFTNGKTVADYTAEYLGLPYSPAYISLFKPKSFKGYNYASGTCGILPLTGLQYGFCLTLDDQIGLFRRTIKDVLTPEFQNKVSEHLAKSIFLFVVGSNDYIVNYFGSFTDSSQTYDPEQFAQLLVESLSQQLKDVYKLGARKVMVSEIGPLGCLPYVVQKSKPNGRCDENKNQMVRIFNNKLAGMLKNLTSTLANSHFMLIHSYKFTYDAVFNPSKYGLSDSSNSCCITVESVLPTCIAALIPCSNPNDRFFWDAVHPTQAVYSIAASGFINGTSSGDFPMNLEQLLQV